MLAITSGNTYCVGMPQIITRESPSTYLDDLDVSRAAAKLQEARHVLLAASVQLDRARLELHEAYAEARRAGLR